jgi:tRNA threonylcarbamoyladenosine biosynthesis protein TsaB
MALILSLETATTVCSAALHKSGALISLIEYHVPQSTASKLAVMIDHLFKLTDHQPSQLNAVAISAGPGSYTGLRIGVATAKGLCYGLNIPLISINTLELMATQVASVLASSPPERAGGEVLLCPMLDARRMEVYCLLAKMNLEIVEVTDAKIIDSASYENQLKKNRIFFFGNGSDKCKTIIEHPNASFIEGITPSASNLGTLAYSKFEKNQFEDLSTYEPYYLKDFLIKKPNTIN